MNKAYEEAETLLGKLQGVSRNRKRCGAFFSQRVGFPLKPSMKKLMAAELAKVYGIHLTIISAWQKWQSGTCYWNPGVRHWLNRRFPKKI